MLLPGWLKTSDCHTDYASLLEVSLSFRARPQPRRGRKEDSSQEEQRARAHWRTPRLHVAEEPGLRRAPYLAMVPFVLLVEKALENH